MYLKVKEVAERLGVSTKTIYRRIKSGSLIAVKLSEYDFRIDEEDLQNFIDSMKTDNL